MSRLHPRSLPIGLASVAVVTAFVGSLAVLRAADSFTQSSGVRAVATPETPLIATVAASPAPAQRARIVVLGDSVAVGGACGCVPFGDLIASAASRSAPQSVLANEARDGLTSSQLLHAVLGGSPGTIKALQTATVVTVTIGANDFDETRASSLGCGGWTNTDCYQRALTVLDHTIHELLVRVRAVAPIAAPVLITGYWNVFLDGAVGATLGPTYQATSDALTRKVNDVIAHQAQLTGASYVDLYRPFKGEGERNDTDLLAADGDHPNEAGQRLIAQIMERQAGIS